MTTRQLSLTVALSLMTLTGLLLIAFGLVAITGHWQHYEDGSGSIGGDMVKIVYCVPTAICAIE